MNANEARQLMKKHEEDENEKYRMQLKKIDEAIKKERDDFDVEDWFRLSAEPNIFAAASAGKNEKFLDVSSAVSDIAKAFLEGRGFEVRYSSFNMRYSDDTPEVTVRGLMVSWA
jgi:hypothetical protein